MLVVLVCIVVVIVVYRSIGIEGVSLKDKVGVFFFFVFGDFVKFLKNCLLVGEKYLKNFINLSNIWVEGGNSILFDKCR